MDRPIQSGTARFIAAVICAAATLTGATTPASAAEGPVPLTVGGVPADPAAAASAAAAIVDTATQAAGAPPVAGATELTPPPGGQYQPPEGQYQGENGQYQEPPAPVEPTDAPPPATAGAPVSLPTNINVSVRVLSPGDDGPVNQSTAGAAQPATSGDGTAIAVSAGPAQVSISVWVNVTNNSTIVFTPPSSSGWYHAPGTQYQTPADITPANETPATPTSSPRHRRAPGCVLRGAGEKRRDRGAADASAAAGRANSRREGDPGTARARAVVAQPVVVAAAVVAADRAPLPAETAAPRRVTVPAPRARRRASSACRTARSSRGPAAPRSSAAPVPPAASVPAPCSRASPSSSPRCSSRGWHPPAGWARACSRQATTLRPNVAARPAAASSRSVRAGRTPAFQRVEEPR